MFLFHVALCPWEEELFGDQFSLHNTGQFGCVPGVDINVVPLWKKGLTGKNVNIAFLISGCNTDHLDFENRFWSNESFNVILDLPDIAMVFQPVLNDGTYQVGTALAGLSGKGIIGVAYESTFSAVVYASTNGTSIFKALSKFMECTARILVIAPIHPVLNYPNQRVDYWARDVPALKPFVRHAIKTDKITIIGNSDLDLKVTDFKDQLLSNFGHFILVASVTCRGSPWLGNIFSSKVLVSAPCSGNLDTKTQHAKYPRLPGSFGSSLTGATYETRKSASASLVAGVCALLLELNPKLTAQDIRYILILSATVCDPKSTFWAQNSAGFFYHPGIGFGLVDADLAAKLAENWAQLPKSVKIEVKKSSNFKLLGARQGVTKIPFEVPDSLEFIEYIELLFNSSLDDISAFRISLISPSQTRAILMTPTGSAGRNLVPQFYQIRLMARNFFGEEMNGIWTLEIIYSSYDQSTQLSDFILSFFGQKTKPIFPKITKRVVDDAEYPIANKGSLQLDLDHDWDCGVPTKVRVTTAGLNTEKIAPTFLVNKTSMEYYEFDPIKLDKLVEIQPPCVFSPTDDLVFTVQLRDYDLFVSADIRYMTNFKSEGLISPQAYDKQKENSDSIFKLSMKWSRLQKHIYGPQSVNRLRVAFYDYETKQMEYSQLIRDSGSYNLSVPHFEEPIKKVVMIVTPIYQSNISPCNDWIVPLTLTQKGVVDTIGKPIFPIPLSSFCPAPDGILVGPEVDPNAPGETKDKMNIGAVVASAIVLLFAFGVAVVAICWIQRNRRKERPSTASFGEMIKDEEILGVDE